MCRSRRELSNAYFLAKFRFDTAENEPSKVCLIAALVSAGSARGRRVEAAAQRKAVDEQKRELLIQKYDADGSGVMEFDEFVEMMVALPPRLAARVLWI